MGQRRAITTVKIRALQKDRKETGYDMESRVRLN